MGVAFIVVNSYPLPAMSQRTLRSVSFFLFASMTRALIIVLYFRGLLGNKNVSSNPVATGRLQPPGSREHSNLKGKSKSTINNKVGISISFSCVLASHKSFCLLYKNDKPEAANENENDGLLFT